MHSLVGVIIQPPPLARHTAAFDCMRKVWQFLMAAGTLVAAAPVLASDPSGIVGVLFLVLAVVFLPLFGCCWLVTSRIKPDRVKSLVRVACFFIYWAPSELPATGPYWPVALALFESEFSLGNAVKSIFLCSGVVWVAVLIYQGSKRSQI